MLRAYLKEKIYIYISFSGHQERRPNASGTIEVDEMIYVEAYNKNSFVQMSTAFAKIKKLTNSLKFLLIGL